MGHIQSYRHYGAPYNPTELKHNGLGRRSRQGAPVIKK